MTNKELNFRVLDESLRAGESNIPPEYYLRKDFRKLKVVYRCNSGEEEKESCKYFIPGRTGNCTFQDREFCKKELGFGNG